MLEKNKGIRSIKSLKPFNKKQPHPLTQYKLATVQLVLPARPW